VPQDVLKARYLNEFKKELDEFMEEKSNWDFILKFENS